ncbi:hypothetical protein H4R20_005221 [Coemansia guatemalensis]|uniref:Uncharacterized protein n=1 Tax=Coemansia guatemalensis TaxID=2761395 RepID=A0A9W8LS24_9FUNG|nr:hypothetical protein H4R20_005221 [Coemansia guatemalensis]
MSLTTSGGVTIIDTLTVSEEGSTDVLSSVFTTAITYLSTVTETVSSSEATEGSLTTYTTAFTDYTTVTETEGPTPTTPGSSVSFPTLIVGGTGEVSGVTIIGALYEVWMFILCPSRDCTPWREWLTYIPNVAAGWVLGAIALLLGLALLLMAFKCGALEYIFGFLAMALVAICLFIRAGLKDTSADRFAMYKASIWLNYFAAVLLLLLIVQLLFRLIVHLDHTLCRVARVLVGFVYLVSLALFALLTAAVVLMFDKHLFSRVHAGIGCLQAFVIVVLVLSFILMLATFWASGNDHKGYHIAHVIIIGLCLVFMLVWGSYMTAREFLDLHSAARHSEALWYVFNIVPLLLVAVVLLVLNAPSMFTFCHCPVNSCPVSNPHVRYSSTGAGPHTHSHDREANVQRYYM